jgi:hypothetical protein
MLNGANGTNGLPHPPVDDYRQAPRASILDDAAPEVPELAGVLSPSQCACWNQCSAKWWFRYGLQERDIQGSARGIGKAIHSTMRANFAQKIETHRDLPVTAIQAIFDEHWTEEAEQTEFQAGENSEALATMGRACVTKYIKIAAPAIQPAKVELKVEGVINSVAVRGYVDILDIHGRIIDLKSAKTSPPKNTVRPDYVFQIATYSAITPGASGEARLDTVVKLQRDIKLVSTDFTVSEADRRHVNIMYPLAQEGMRSGLYMPNRSGLLCSRRYCGYFRLCEEEYGGEVKA